MSESSNIRLIEETIGGAFDAVESIVTSEREMVAALDAIGAMTGIFIARNTDNSPENHDENIVDAFSKRVALGIKVRRGEI